MEKEPIWYKYINVDIGIELDGYKKGYEGISIGLGGYKKGDIVSVAFRNNIFGDRITHIKHNEKTIIYQTAQIYFYNSFMLLADWREEQIDNILND